MKFLLSVLFVLLCTSLPAQEADKVDKSDESSKQDRLRGSIGEARSWWDLQHYHLSLQVFPDEKRIAGSNVITFKTLKSEKRMQIDLQQPLEITKVIYSGKELKIDREGNVYWLTFENPLTADKQHKIEVFYEGVPTVSKRPPWEGGFTWKKDKNGKPQICTTCQGIGASIWWPNKDHGADEPDNGMAISVTVPQDLVAVANGRLNKQDHDTAAKTKTYHWVVTQPINNYCVNVNIADYVSFEDKYDGEFGKLDISYWVFRGDRERAEKQFKEAPRTIKAFEHLSLIHI